MVAAGVRPAFGVGLTLNVNCCLTEERSSRVWSMVLTVPATPAAPQVPGAIREEKP